MMDRILKWGTSLLSLVLGACGMFTIPAAAYMGPPQPEKTLIGKVKNKLNLDEIEGIRLIFMYDNGAKATNFSKADGSYTAGYYNGIGKIKADDVDGLKNGAFHSAEIVTHFYNDDSRMTNLEILLDEDK